MIRRIIVEEFVQNGNWSNSHLLIELKSNWTIGNQDNFMGIWTEMPLTRADDRRGMEIRRFNNIPGEGEFNSIPEINE